MSERNNEIRDIISEQDIEFNRERIINLRISTISDICITVIFAVGVGFIIYYIIVKLGYI